ncbi:hypothetical protein ACT6QG_05270 [Xanthobacter sp. TB0136]|uniref:hypothetical protein n=1 Tax=Xanthobacter sp. TB0136 TaxID=3459177 RepID=UPI00403A4D66
MAANDERFRALAKAGRGPIWDETLRLFPQKKGAVDPSRPQHEFKAAVRQGDEWATNASGGGARDWSVKISAGTAKVFITRATYGGPNIAVGDRVRRLDRANQPFYEVATVNDRDEGDLVLVLNQAG